MTLEEHQIEQERYETRLRDTFAAAAITGVASEGLVPDDDNDAKIADNAYRIADAMMERRKQ